MTGSKRFVVLEVADQADVIKECIEFLALSQPAIGLKSINHREATNVLYFITRDRLDGRLAHKHGNPENVETIMSILWGIPRNKLAKQHHDAYKVIVTHSLWSGVETSVEIQLGIHIKQGDWTDWTVVKVGNLVGLAEGEDHRITEYHKEDKALSDEDEAVVTINCKNPINYLYNQFKQTYGSNMVALMNHIQDPNVKMDPLYRKLVADFFNDPSPFIVSLFLDTLIKINPQIELGDHAVKLSPFFPKMLGIHDLERFQSEVVSKLIIAFGLGWLGFDIKKDESYTLEYYNTTHVMAIFKKQYVTMSEKYEEELLHSLIRGDYLLEDERVIAERLYIERPHLVLNLSK